MKKIAIRLPILAGIFLFMDFGCQKDNFTTDFIFTQQQELTVNLKKASLKSASLKNYMVISTSESLTDEFIKALQDYGKIVRTIPEIGIVVVNPSVNDFETKVGKLSSVLAVVPDLKTKWLKPVKFVKTNNTIGIGSDETYYSYQWGLDAIDAPEAWNAGYTGKNAQVFILDSGIDDDHPDLSPNLNKSLSTSFVPGETYDIQDGSYFNHGTHVAGIIAAANNQLGVIGVAPDATIVAVKVISEEDGSGDFSWINEGIVYAADHGADVINMSLGTTLNKNGFYLDGDNVLQKVPASYIQEWIRAQQRAINYAYKKGAVVITSAGNESANADGNRSLIVLPADLDNVIAVSATAPDLWMQDMLNDAEPNLDIPASYTNYGKSLIDLAAPGGDFDAYPDPTYFYDMILSTTSEGYAWASGTSMASPHVAGVAALIISKNGSQMSPQMVTKQLLKTADKIDSNGTSSYFGKGRVNAFRAVNQ